MAMHLHDGVYCTTTALQREIFKLRTEYRNEEHEKPHKKKILNKARVGNVTGHQLEKKKQLNHIYLKA